MSRTRGHTNRTAKSSRGGLDMWSRRPMSGNSYSKWARKQTARIERQQEPAIIQEQMYDDYTLEDAYVDQLGENCYEIWHADLDDLDYYINPADTDSFVYTYKHGQNEQTL